MGSIIFSSNKNEGSKNPEPPKAIPHTSDPIRSSTVILIWQIIVLLIVTDVIYALINYFFLRVHFLNLNLPFDLDHYVIGILMIIHVFKTILQIYLLVQIVLKWAGQTYFIHNEHLVKREGIMTITEKSYDLKNIRAVTIHQSIIGKFFHFGDVVVETSASGGYMERFVIIGISNPQKYERLLLHTT